MEAHGGSRDRWSWLQQHVVQRGSCCCSGADAGPELSPLPCLAGTPLPPLLPQPCTIQYLVTHYLDISCVPRRSFFELLAFFSTNELEREKLQEFSSAQGQEELYSYCNRPRRTTLEVRLGAGQTCPRRAVLGLKAPRTQSAIISWLRSLIYFTHFLNPWISTSS